VIYHSQSRKPAVEERFAAQYRSLEELLQQADFICLTLPLTAQTERLIGAEQFALMRPESIFINISRGKVVDEVAMIEALRSKRIRAAGLDVFEREPLNHDSPLLQLSNVVATPHMGSATHETREAMARCAVENLLAALNGQRPANLVNPLI
jgi:phosphogluconate 2-dehydrogenase